MAAGLAPPGAHRVHRLDFHLTLRFLGALSAEALASAEQAASSLRSAPISIRIDRLGCFRRAGVLWCGPEQPGAGLLDLAASLESALITSGLPSEPRPFVPHVTLARRVRPCPSAPWPHPVQWTASELILAFARQGSAPRYMAHRRWQLDEST